MLIWIVRLAIVIGLVTYQAKAELHNGGLGGNSRTTGASAPGGNFGAGTCDFLRPENFNFAANTRPLVTPSQPANQGASNSSSNSSSSNNQASNSGNGLPAVPEGRDKPRGKVAWKCSFEEKDGDFWGVHFDVDKDKNIIVADLSWGKSLPLPMSCPEKGRVCEREIFKGIGKERKVDRTVKVELLDSLKEIKWWPKKGADPVTKKVDCLTPDDVEAVDVTG